MSEQHLYDKVIRHRNIFVSRDLLTKPNGPLTGYIDENDGQICILGLLTRENEVPEVEVEEETAPSATATARANVERVVGYWHGSNRLSFERKSRLSIEKEIDKASHHVLHLIYEEGRIRSSICVDGIREDETHVCIMFDPDDILSSYVLFRSELYDSPNPTKSSMNNVCDENKTNTTIPDILGEKIGLSLQHFQHEKRLPGEHLLYKRPSSSIQTQLPQRTVCILPFIAMTFISYFHVIFHSIPLYVKNVLCVPSFTKHLMERSRRSQNVLQLDQKHLFHKFIRYNTYGQHVCESLIGVYVLYHVTSNNLANEIATCTLDWADDVAQHSHDLIKWLMGAPAGLKLNSQFTGMLGHFFIYHIYLWTGYLGVLRTALPWLLQFASWAGVLGVSFQLCMVKDIISMLTLHIYCFYVYAARIFNLQVSSLSSMWRLFRGKKWNTLRSRVDSAAYNMDQLFVGTLLFTVLLFLLPTTALYYAVFTGLRVVTLTVQACLTRVINVISMAPVYTLLVRVVRPKWIAGRVEFEPIRLDTPPSNLVLAMKTSQLSVSELINLTTPHLQKASSPTYSWSQFLSCVTSGKILYPWMEVITDDKDGEADEKTKKD